jgi:hypothetical protein
VLLDQVRAEAKQGHDRCEVERAVEIGAAQVRAGVGQHVAATIDPAALARPDADDGEVARAAANVGDQHQLFALYRLLIVMSRGDRFVDEGDVAKSGAPCDCLEHLLRSRIRAVVAIHEAHRPAVHDGHDLLPCECFGLVLQVPHKDLDDFGQRHHAVAQASLFVDQGGAQDRLQGTHQPAFGLSDIGRDGFGAEQHPALRLVVEEHRTRHQRAAAFERCERDGSVASDADGRIRRAEIQSAGNHSLPLHAQRGTHLLRCA